MLALNYGAEHGRNGVECGRSAACVLLLLVLGVNYGLVGRNGVGKTTLLRQLSEGLIRLPPFLNVVHVEQEIRRTDNRTSSRLSP